MVIRYGCTYSEDQETYPKDFILNVLSMESLRMNINNWGRLAWELEHI